MAVFGPAVAAHGMPVHTCRAPSVGADGIKATVAAGFGSVGVAIDLATHTVYVANAEDTSVSVINGTTCNCACRESRPPL